MQSNYFIADDPLSLDRIRSVLTRLEDTIIFTLIERAQFAHNPRMYEPRAFTELTAMGFEGSWLRWFLKEIESFHGACARRPWLRVCKAHARMQQRRGATRGRFFRFMHRR
jgi:chorismate mutase